MNFINSPLKIFDPEINELINGELNKQQNQIELIASENIALRSMLEAQGSVLTNKYAEGYPKARYYGGCHFVDEIETLAIERAKTLFKCEYANVQPHSGSNANFAVFYSLLTAGDTILGMDLAAGGHLTHGFAKNMSGKLYKAVNYGLGAGDLIDYNEVERLAIEHKPKLIIAGFSAYSRIIDWSKFREIADKVGAYFMADMAHVAGLVAADVYPSPIPYADVVTTTTHKTMQGPRGGMILSRDIKIGKKISSGVFPGTQGGPLMHVIAAKAVMLKQALMPEFKTYCKQVVDNARAMSDHFIANSIDVVSGGTDNHLLLLDLRKTGVNGKDLCDHLEDINIITNKNLVPNDPLPATLTSGLRIGTPAGTARGFKQDEFTKITGIIISIINELSEGKDENLALAKEKYRKEVKDFCVKFPIYEYLSVNNM